MSAHVPVDPVAAVTQKYSQRDRAESHCFRGTAVYALRVWRQLKERLDLRSQPSLQLCVPLVRVRVAHRVLDLRVGSRLSPRKNFTNTALASLGAASEQSGGI
eukprot:scaffold35483_cov69-Phaeocystis_antarctica.AAC.4